jgi:hypothetical protein
MEKILRGKYLVRKSKTDKGEDVLTLTGVFYPQNFELDEISDGDEMWVSEIHIPNGGIKFTHSLTGVDGGSPEDFLEGINQSPLCWKNKELL